MDDKEFEQKLFSAPILIKLKAKLFNMDGYVTKERYDNLRSERDALIKANDTLRQENITTKSENVRLENAVDRLMTERRNHIDDANRKITRLEAQLEAVTANFKDASQDAADYRRKYESEAKRSASLNEQLRKFISDSKN